MTIRIDNISVGDVVLFNHNKEVWWGVCRGLEPPTIVIEVNKALWIGINPIDVVRVLKKGV
mgnify:CR=1 FL=1